MVCQGGGTYTIKRVRLSLWLNVHHTKKIAPGNTIPSCAPDPQRPCWRPLYSRNLGCGIAERERLVACGLEEGVEVKQILLYFSLNAGPSECDRVSASMEISPRSRGPVESAASLVPKQRRAQAATALFAIPAHTLAP